MKFKEINLGNLTRILIVILVGALMQLSYIGYLVASSPSSIRSPKLEHFHFRMQILVNGKAEDFSANKYQIGYSKDQCSVALPGQPIHFHDEKDQMTHIHWQGMTGGTVMKYYGWNYIGGMSNALGYRTDKLSDIQKVSIHGNILPPAPSSSQLYVYTGDEHGYQERSFEDWKNQRLEVFFGVKSNMPTHDMNKGDRSSLMSKMFPKAYAHGSASDADGNDGTETEEEKLTRINNLIGSVVIFAQENKPTDQQVKDRFNRLEPLTDSTCGG